VTAIRPTAVAGAFYPADAGELERQLTGFLAAAQVPADAPVPKAIIAPHAGAIYSGPVAASVYARLAPARGRVGRVVLIGPSHRVGFRGLALSGAEAWRTPLGLIQVDRAAYQRLAGLPMVGVLDAAHAQEHSLEVHLPFLQLVLGDFQLVPVVAGEATADEVAALLESVWGGPETLIVISTDLSHYLDYAACGLADGATVAAIERLDGAAIGRDGACGRVPVGGLLLAARRHGMTIETVDVRNSGDTAGPKDRVVGYGSWALFEPEKRAHPLAPALLALARESITHGLANGRPKPSGTAEGALAQPGAVFVTLKKDGQLRGCIGSATAWRPLVEDVVDNAFKAAFGDPRFPPLKAEEWASVQMSVSLLTPPSPMTIQNEADLLAQLRPGVDGLIIEDGNRRALFLPSVWEQLPDRRQFLGHLKLKAGMAADHWSPAFRASRFEAVEMR